MHVYTVTTGNVFLNGSTANITEEENLHRDEGENDRFIQGGRYIWRKKGWVAQCHALQGVPLT